MPSGEDTPLANGWQGLDRSTAPHVLPESKSPDTTDCGFGNDTIGLLGPRKGRTVTYTNGYNIMGVIPFNVPWGQFHIVAGNDGTVSPVAADWPVISPTILPVYAPGTGWNRLLLAAAVVGGSQAGAGTTTFASTAFTSINGNLYGEALLLYTPAITLTSNGTTTYAEWTWNLELQVDGVWTSHRQIIGSFGSVVSPGALQGQTNAFSLAGAITGARQKLTVTGTGTVSCAQINSMELHFVIGAQGTTWTT